MVLHGVVVLLTLFIVVWSMIRGRSSVMRHHGPHHHEQHHETYLLIIMRGASWSSFMARHDELALVVVPSMDDTPNYDILQFFSWAARACGSRSTIRHIGHHPSCTTQHMHGGGGAPHHVGWVAILLAFFHALPCFFMWWCTSCDNKK